MAVDLNEWISSHYLLAALSYFKSPAPQLRANAALLVSNSYYLFTYYISLCS